MQKKIVFFDIDGTIYHYKRGVIGDSRQAIRELRKKGSLAFLCTGRTRPMITPDICEIGFDGIIAGGGTYAEWGGNPLYRVDLSDDMTDRAIASMRKHGVMPVPEGHDYMYFEKPEKIVDTYKRAYGLYQKLIPGQIREIEPGKVHAAKVSGAFTENSDVGEIKKELSEHFVFVNHGNELLELIPVGYSKAEGIKKIITHLDIPWENTYAFGDSFNDLEMLTYVNYGIAMGNSDPKLFEYVKYRTLDYDKGGIRAGLKRFGLID